jgi:hypothetical protein
MGSGEKASKCGWCGRKIVGAASAFVEAGEVRIPRWDVDTGIECTKCGQRCCNCSSLLVMQQACKCGSRSWKKFLYSAEY